MIAHLSAETILAAGYAVFLVGIALSTWAQSSSGLDSTRYRLMPIYAWRIVPAEAFPVEERRALRWYCVFSGVAGCLFALGLKTNRCEQCGLTNWRGQTLKMALHHRNGDGSDNRLENLELLCPNCHSQTDNFSGRKLRGRKRGSGLRGAGSRRSRWRGGRPRRGRVAIA